MEAPPPPGLSATFKNYENLTLPDSLKIHFQRFFALNQLLHLILNELNGDGEYQLIDLYCGFVISFCIVYLVKIPLAYKF